MSRRPPTSVDAQSAFLSSPAAQPATAAQRRTRKFPRHFADALPTNITHPTLPFAYVFFLCLFLIVMQLYQNG